MIRSLMQRLVALQNLELQTGRGAKERETEIKALRETVPAPIQGHFDRLLQRGKKAMAPVRHGTCSACHIRVPIGVQATLAHGDDVQLCGNCGRYLYLPDEELASLTQPEPAPKQPRKKRREETAVHAG